MKNQSEDKRHYFIFQAFWKKNVEYLLQMRFCWWPFNSFTPDFID
jgi:hypothetical protein